MNHVLLQGKLANHFELLGFPGTPPSTIGSKGPPVQTRPLSSGVAAMLR